MLNTTKLKLFRLSVYKKKHSMPGSIRWSNMSRQIEGRSPTDVKAFGSWKIKLSGHSEELNASLAGDGNLYSCEMTVNKATISTAGSSKARVVVSELLSASASGDGHILYKGNPVKLNSNVSESGKIKMSSE